MNLLRSWQLVLITVAGWSVASSSSQAVPVSDLALVVQVPGYETSIANFGAGSLSFDAYSIESISGSLDLNSWVSLDQQGTGDWSELSSDAFHLREANLVGSLTLNVGERVSIGVPFDFISPDFLADAQFKYHTEAGDAVVGAVVYVQVPEPSAFLLLVPIGAALVLLHFNRGLHDVHR